MANWNNEKMKYYITLLIHENTVSKWDMLDDAIDIEMEADMKSIKRDMAQYVTDLLIDGFFKKYIDRYEYELKCFDRGFEVLERERKTSK